MVLAVIENISVIGFVDFAVRIADQHVVLAHVGPVGSGIRSRQVTQLVLFDGVLRRLILRRRGNDSNLLIVFYVQIMPDDFVMQLHRF